MSAIKKLEPLAALFPPNAGQLYRRIRTYTGYEDFTGMRVLDIGAGIGLDSCGISLLGASEIIALEPELDGATAKITSAFKDNMAKLGLNNIHIENVAIQDFSHPPESFDLIIMIAVINHLDEESVVVLHKDPTAQQRYVEILQMISQWLKPGGRLALYDAARYHAFMPLINMGIIDKHPMAPTIEWHKHQQPNQWINVLERAGYHDCEVVWSKVRGVSIPLWNFIVSPYFSIYAHKPHRKS